jgi:outer membrane receptor protein involved in Fe transport
MRDWQRPISRTAPTLAIAALLCLGAATAAHGDVFGRLSIKVTDSSTHKPVAGAKVTLHDTAGVHADTVLTTDSSGTITSPLLEIRQWEIITDSDTYEEDDRMATVASDSTTEVDIAMETKKETVIKISGVKNSISVGQTQSSTRRDAKFIDSIPAGGANSQSIQKLLLTNPGFVGSTVGVDHPRGEHASTTINIDGFELPGADQGRAGQILSAGVIQSLDAITGAFAPEYGSESAAILNLNLKTGTIKPFEDITLSGGSYNTFSGDITLGGQSGEALIKGDDSENSPKKFRYLVDINDRSTANALEPPQPYDQTAHNAGDSATIFGNFAYLPDNKDQISLTLNSAPAFTEIANRTGLPGKYAPVGQGYGYGGSRDADGTEPIDPAYQGENLLGSAPIVLGSQQADGQDITQQDNNYFGVLNYRHDYSDTLSSLISFGSTHSGMSLQNHSPSINYNFNPDGTLTTIDNSIEFNPDMTRNYDQDQLQGSVTDSVGPHTLKAGIIADDQHGNESYYFAPQSQLALDAEYAAAPQLAPAGAPTGATDVLGNPVYLMTPGATIPTVTVKRTGYYGAGYLQDTWNASRKITFNYGVRYDIYHQAQTPNDAPTSTITKSQLSPRLNSSFLIAPQTILRLSYDKMFTQPPLAQGGSIGVNILPESIDQYEANIERQIAPRQTVKIAYYYKNIRNQDDTGILLPFTQIGAYQTLNYQYASVHGIEFTYDHAPKNNLGLQEYISYAYSRAKPGGLDETLSTPGNPVAAPIINDHNQDDTLSVGGSYTFKSQALIGADLYYGSGEASSALVPITIFNSNELDGGHTIAHTTVNLRIASAPKMLGVAGLQLDVVNVFNDLSPLNFNSGFSGTRFQQGRTFILSMNAKF